MNSKNKSMSMKELYRQVRHYTQVGIEGYHVPKKYQDPSAIIRSKDETGIKRRRTELKRGSYLEDQYKIKKNIPGVWKYNIIPIQQQTKSKRKIHINQSQKSTYLNEAIKQSKKDNVPAPGHYNVLQMMGSKLANSSLHQSKSGNYSQKMLKLDKISYLDNAEYEGSITPGVGQYFINRPIRAKTQQAVNKKPQFWIQHHKNQQLVQKQKVSKQVPAIGTYDPKPVSYQLFEQKKKVKKSSSQRKLQKSTDRFKTQNLQIQAKGKLGPGQYNIINQWSYKDKSKKGVLSVISKLSPPSIYYH